MTTLVFSAGSGLMDVVACVSRDVHQTAVQVSGGPGEMGRGGGKKWWRSLLAPDSFILLLRASNRSSLAAGNQVDRGALLGILHQSGAYLSLPTADTQHPPTPPPSRVEGDFIGSYTILCLAHGKPPVLAASGGVGLQGPRGRAKRWVG